MTSVNAYNQMLADRIAEREDNLAFEGCKVANAIGELLADVESHQPTRPRIAIWRDIEAQAAAQVRAWETVEDMED